MRPHEEPGDVRIREATPGDAGAISALICSLAPLLLDDPADADAPFLRFVSPESVAGYLSDPAYGYHVAEEDGRIVGVVAVRGGTHLYHLFVAERHHGRGLGTRLWAHARAAAGHDGPFTVNASANAVAFYLRLGFQSAGPAASKDGVTFTPMVLGGERADG